METGQSVEGPCDASRGSRREWPESFSLRLPHRVEHLAQRDVLLARDSGAIFVLRRIHVHSPACSAPPVLAFDRAPWRLNFDDRSLQLAALGPCAANAKSAGFVEEDRFEQPDLF